MKVKADEVRLIEAAETRGHGQKAAAVCPPQRPAPASPARELDIRGMETLEAESVLENYIDAAVMAHLETVTIIHGKGTGALRKAVRASSGGTKPSRASAWATMARASRASLWSS